MEFDEKEDQEAEMEMETETETNHDYSLSNSSAVVEIGGRRKIIVRYRECLKNHAVSIGGQAVDGCCEFMPAGEEGSLDALKCAACNCHRNFHRKESDYGGSNSIIVGGGGVQPESSSQNQHHYNHQNHQFSSYYRAPPPPAGYLHLTCTPPPTNPHPHQMRPLALPPSTAIVTSGGGGGGYAGEDEDISNPTSSGGGGGSGGGISKKRFRTKFTQEQKEKMLGLAERIGWRIQKQDEASVDEFCQENGVRKQVLKVWMHNNKHILNKKP